MATEFSYSFSLAASQDLTKALEYIESELSNPKAANDLAVKIFDGIDNIRNFPESGIKIDNIFIADQSLRKFLVGNYIVFYKIDYELATVIIVRIIYGARNIDEVLLNGQ